MEAGWNMFSGAIDLVLPLATLISDVTSQQRAADSTTSRPETHAETSQNASEPQPERGVGY